ncbi:MAG: hypothetical protein LV473_02440 [Nitrospira sp.]|nr:hypothetical protein [Nitrospira sp.]
MIELAGGGRLVLKVGALAMLVLGCMVSPVVVSAEDVSEEAKASLQKAHDQLELAIDQAEKALGPHRKGSGWVRVHMQRVLNILGGKDSPEYTDSQGYTDKFEPRFTEKVGNPGDGHGVLIYLEDANDALKAANAPAAVQEAVGYAITHASMAVQHAHESVHGTGIKQTHEHASHVAALLVGAHGKGDTDSPATGTLTYAMRQAGLKISK